LVPSLKAEWFENAGPGGWNDPDLLEVGNGGMTTSEYRSQFAIWSLMKAPLLISTDVTNMTSETLEILGNTEVIAINQDKLGVAGRVVEERPPDPVHLQVWAGPLSGGKVAVVLWNRGNVTAEILGRFVDMQLDGKVSVRDCLAHKDLGVASGQINMNVSAHDVQVLVLTPTTDDGDVLPTPSGAEEATESDAAWAATWKGHGIAIPQSRLAWEAQKLG
jgi:alpha-galactosidase